MRYILLLTLFVVSACTNSISLQSSWQSSARPTSPFKHVLVVAVSENFDRRRLFENALVDELSAAGVQATPSTRSMVTKDVLNREFVTKLVKATGADSVLVTRLVHQDVDLQERRGRIVAKIEDPVGFVPDITPYGYDLYAYDFQVTWEPSTLVINRKIDVTTDLFEIKEGKLLYAIRSKLKVSNSQSFDQNSDVAVIDTLSEDLVKRLRRDKAIR